MKLFKISIETKPGKLYRAFIKGQHRAKKLAVTLLRREQQTENRLTYNIVVVSFKNGRAYYDTREGQIVVYTPQQEDDYWILSEDEEESDTLDYFDRLGIEASTIYGRV